MTTSSLPAHFKRTPGRPVRACHHCRVTLKLLKGVGPSLTKGASGGVAIVVVELQATQARPCFDGALGNSHGIVCMNDAAAAQSLVVPLAVVVRHVLANFRAKVSLSEWDDLAETLLLDGQDESLREGVQIGAAGRQSHWFRTAVDEHLPEAGCE